MSDPRLTPANMRVAAETLRGQIDNVLFTKGAARQIAVPVADLALAPGGGRTRQLLIGAPVTCYECHQGHAFVQAEDGYVGYLPEAALAEAALAEAVPPTHWVSARATHIYSAPNLKSPERTALSHLARVAVLSQAGNWAETPLGYLPLQHLNPLPMQEKDPVAMARLYLGTPYLWGGNSAHGIDCSGLVQAACRACGIACPGDSDLQEAALGKALAASDTLARGDLVFWRGHVAWMLDETRILHANAHDMAVSIESLEAATARIAAAGGGPITARKRIFQQI